MNIVTTAKWLCKKALVNCNALKYANELYSNKYIVILKYHSIQDKPELYDDSIDPGIITSTRDFKKHMEIVSKQFNSVTMDDILLYIRGDKNLPKRAVAVTFDDGYDDNFRIGAPILEHFSIRAAFYVTVDSIGATLPPWFIRVRHAIWTTRKKEWVAPPDNRIFKIENRNDRVIALRHASKQCASLVRSHQDQAVRSIENAMGVNPFTPKKPLMMEWKKIKKLHQKGHIIGSHTLTHPNLAHVGKKDLLCELTESKRILEKELGAPVIHFSYPNPALTPQFTEQTTVAVNETQYETAVLSSHGPINKGNDPLLLERLSAATPQQEFLWNLECTLLGRHM